MDIKYKIISVDENEHSMVVRFFTGTMTEEDLALEVNGGEVTRARTDYNITVWPTPAPTGDELHEYIMRHAPLDFFALHDAIKDPGIDTSLTEAKAMVGQVHVLEVDRIGPQRQLRIRKKGP